MSARLAVAFALACCSGCGQSGPASCFAASVVDGSPRRLAAGDPLPVVMGPQGLYMAVVGVVAEHIEPGTAGDVTNADNPTYSATLTLGGATLASRSGKVGFEALPDGSFLLPEVRLIFGTAVPAAAGSPCELTLEVHDDQQRSCSARLEVVPQRP